MDGIGQRNRAGAKATGNPEGINTQADAASRSGQISEEGLKTLQPMNINEAIEAMKIIAPYASKLVEAENAIQLIRTLIDSFPLDERSQLLRLIALMHHEHLDTVVELLKDKSGMDFTLLLSAGINANNIFEMIENIYFLGLAKTEPVDAARE